MWQIFTGSLLLSLIHASVPNHWIPLIAIGKSEEWTVKETLSGTIITGFAHTLSTILIGIIVGLVGIKISNSYSLIVGYIAPSILITIGIMYIILDFIRQGHHHHIEFRNISGNGTKSKMALLSSLSLGMFLSPCIEIEAYYFQAGMIGWKGIFMVSTVYTITTVLLMLLLVYSGLKGTQNLKLHALEHHEKVITGSILVVMGIVQIWLRF